MTLIKQTKSETQRWEDKGDGNQELVTDIVICRPMSTQ